MATAAERRKLQQKAKEELAARLNAEPDRRKRKQLEREWKALQDAEAGDDSPLGAPIVPAAAAMPNEEETSAPGPAKATDIRTGADEEPRGFWLQEKPKSKAQLKKERADQRKKEEMEKLKEEMKATDLSEPEIRRIQSKLAPFNLRIHEIPGDGNCLYRAIEHQLRIHVEDGPPYGYRKLREVAADRLESHREDLIYFLDEESQTEAGFQKYLDQLKHSDEFGGELEVRLIAEALDVPIRIFQDSGHHSYNEQSTAAPLNLSFHRHMFSSHHYNSLVPAGHEHHISGNE